MPVAEKDACRRQMRQMVCVTGRGAPGKDRNKFDRQCGNTYKKGLINAGYV